MFAHTMHICCVVIYLEIALSILKCQWGRLGLRVIQSTWIACLLFWYHSRLIPAIMISLNNQTCTLYYVWLLKLNCNIAWSNCANILTHSNCQKWNWLSLLLLFLLSIIISSSADMHHSILLFNMPQMICQKSNIWHSIQTWKEFNDTIPLELLHSK